MSKNDWKPFWNKTLNESILNEKKPDKTPYAIEVLSTKDTDTKGRWNILVEQSDFVAAKKHILPIIATLLTTVKIQQKYKIEPQETHSLTNSYNSDYTSLWSTIAKSTTLNLSEEKYAYIPTDINYSTTETTAWTTQDTISRISNPTTIT